MLINSCLLFIVLFAVYQDMQSYKIKNDLILSGLIIGVLFLIINGKPVTIIMHLIGMFLPIVVFLPLFIFRMIGAGDIKLLSIIGLFLGPKQVLFVAFLAFLVGGIQATLLFLKNRNLKERITYFLNYLLKKKGKLVVGYYDKKKDNYKNALHFSVPILIALLLYMIDVWRLHWGQY